MNRVVLLTCFAAACAFAQSDRGALSGQITDPSAAGVPGADIQAVSLATGVKSSTKSLDNGSYLLGALPFGTYDVTVSAAGFSKVSQQKVEISIGQTRALSFTLTVGQIDQTVEVISSSTPVDSTSAVTATVIAPEQVLALPLAVSGNVRNPESFILLTPGVTGDTGNTQINGSPSRAKEVMFDGATATGPGTAERTGHLPGGQERDQVRTRAR